MHVNSLGAAAGALFICTVKSEAPVTSLSVSVLRSGGEGGGDLGV